VTRERFNDLVAELYGDPPAPAPQPPAPPSKQQAVVQAAAQVAAQPAVPVDSARLTKAMDLVLASAVSLLPDGTARVRSGSHTYHLTPDCTCEDAQRRGTGCKHKLAVEIQRRATTLLEGTAHAPAHGPTLAAPSASQPEAPAAVPPPLPSAPASAAWPVAEAPASACFKFRLGASMELLYTFRGSADAELQTRIKATLPLLQDILDACEARAARRTAEREAAQAAQAAQAQQAPQVQPPTGAPADLQALLQQVVQQALAVQGQSGSNAPSAAPAPANGSAPATPKDFCPIHQVQMYLNNNERGSWYSHLATDDEGQEYFCKGRPRRNGR
jgi:hypothetical protein